MSKYIVSYIYIYITLWKKLKYTSLYIIYIIYIFGSRDVNIYLQNRAEPGYMHVLSTNRTINTDESFGMSCTSHYHKRGEKKIKSPLREKNASVVQID